MNFARRLPAACLPCGSRIVTALGLGLSLATGLAPAAPLAATPPADPFAAHVLACTACHGRQGRATSHGYFPRIAGKPAGYLYNQLLNFREGRRSYGPMSYLLEHLTDEYLREMAAHFAAQELPYPPPQTAGAPPVLLERGEALVRRGDPVRRIPACVQCHGTAMTGVQPAVPGLLGLPRDYLNGQLGAWRSGQRRAQAPDCMAQIARQLTPQDIGALSTWLSSQPVPDGGRPAPAHARPLPLRCGGVPEVAQ